MVAGKIDFDANENNDIVSKTENEKQGDKTFHFKYYYEQLYFLSNFRSLTCLSSTIRLDQEKVLLLLRALYFE